MGHGACEWTIVDGDTTLADYWSRYGSHSSSITNTGDWNDEGQKEISVDTADFTDYYHGSSQDSIDINNYVDVNLHVTDMDTTGGVIYRIEGAKRGTVDLSDSHTVNTLYISSIHSNNANWGNMFEITGSEQMDHVSISGISAGTQYTEFSVDLKGGDDTFSAGLNDATSASQTRFVDGGDGVDTLYMNDSDAGLLTDFDFVNFEIIRAGDGNVTLDEDNLVHNGTQDSPLIVAGAAELNFVGDVESISAVETDYINEYGQHEDGYYEVTVDYADASYTVITDNVDDAWLA